MLLLRDKPLSGIPVHLLAKVPMLSRRNLLLGALGGTVLGLSACRSQAVLKPEAAVTDLTPEKLRGAILRGAAAARWKASEVRPGCITAVYSKKGFVACVDILYDANGYRIEKNPKTNMNTGEDEVNRHYNSWVKRLNQMITREVALAGV
jgi:hypothetical protein